MDCDTVSTKWSAGLLGNSEAGRPFGIVADWSERTRFLLTSQWKQAAQKTGRDLGCSVSFQVKPF